MNILAFFNTINILCTENDQENESVNETVTKADTIEEKEYKSATLLHIFNYGNKMCIIINLYT